MSLMPLSTFGALITAMAAAYGLARWLTGLSRGWALRCGVVSVVTDRSSHSEPTPRLGGIGLALGFAGGAVFFLAAARWSDVEAAFGVSLWLAAGWIGMLLVGLADDRWDLPPLVKLAGMTLAALAPVVGGVRLEPAQAAGMADGLHGALGFAVALAWILFFVNAFNFMDGMDGFAAGFARIAATALFLVVLLPTIKPETTAQVGGEAYLLPILAMACWGFLHWNRPPARVFMGDGGSLSGGYVLAVIPLLGQGGRLGVAMPWIGSLTILLPFVFDVLLTLARRSLRGENVLRAHREHLYQRLMKTGLSHAEVLRINVVRFLLCAAFALIGRMQGGAPGEWLGLGLAMVVMIEYWRMTLRRERARVTPDRHKELEA
jgi:UDP-N-acetylmuramyl pentapeptide phosphotransferase/UDP-N-acetylglucosamine-1-phosphate transferase